MRARVPTSLVNGLVAFVIFAGLGFVSVVLGAEAAAPGVMGYIRGPLLSQLVTFLLGILALQVGDAEHGYGALGLRQRGVRLVSLVGLALALVFPFLFVQWVEGGAPVLAGLGVLAFLLAYGGVWALAGYGAAAAFQGEGLRFVVKYGLYVAVVFLPLVGVPMLCPLVAVGALWEGEWSGLWGLALYGGVGILAGGALCIPRRCLRRSGGGSGSGTDFGPSSSALRGSS